MPYRRSTCFLNALDGTRLAYHTHIGDLPEAHAVAALVDRPTVLLTNGVGTSENFWRYIIADLEQDHRVVHWDFRGHGQSEASASDDYSLSTHVADLERITEAVMAQGDGRPPHHIAFSMGVRVVLELYRRRPDWAAAMSLIAGGPASPDPDSWSFPVLGGRRGVACSFRALAPMVPKIAPLAHRLLASHLAYPFARITGLLHPSAPRADIQELTYALRRMDPRAWWLTVLGLLEAPPCWDVLSRVHVPTQIIAARDDIMVPLREMLRMREALPSARWILVGNAGHAGLIEAGTEIAEAIRAFRQECGVGPAYPEQPWG
jgi:pimeloyl-ACP methyl ester carboxylesterase